MGKNEQKVEDVRSQLCNHNNFKPFEIFQIIDQKNK